MNSGKLAYEPSLTTHAEGQLAHRAALPADEAPADEASAAIAERVDRGTDWPVVFAILTPVVAAYAAIAYGVHAFVNAAF